MQLAMGDQLLYRLIRYMRKREKPNLGELWDIIRPFRIYEKGE